MADPLVTETEKSQRKRILMEAAQDATTASAASEGETPKAEEKKDDKSRARKMGEAAVESGKGIAKPLVDAAKATVHGVKEGGKKVADAIYPAALNESTPSAGGRAADAGLGLLEQAMAALGVNAGASLGESAVAGPHEDDTVPLPQTVQDLLRKAEELFAVPQNMRDIAGAKEEDRPRVIHEQRERAKKPFTYKELAGFVGSLAGPGALHGLKAAEKPKVEKVAEPSKAAAPAAPASKPPAAGPVEPGPFPRHGTLKEKTAWNEAQKAYRKAKPVEAPKPAPAAVEPTVPESPLDAAINAPDAKPPAPVQFQGLQETSKDGSKPPMELWGLTEDIPGHVKGSTVGRATLEAAGFEVPAAPKPRLTPEDIHAAVMRDGGATLDPRTGQLHPGEEGFVVSDVGEMNTPRAEFTAEHLRQFAEANKDRLAEPDAYHGAWDNNGIITQDVSRIMPDLEQAKARGVANKQKAIFDLKTKTEIFLEEQAPLAAEPLTEPIKPAENANVPPKAQGEPGELSPLEMDPLAITPEAVAASVPAEQMPVKADPFLEGTEAAGAKPEPMPTNTVADLHAAAAPLIEQVAAEAKAAVVEGKRAQMTEAQVREEANVMAAEMRAQGKTRAEINEAYRAKLNEAGIESKKQKAAKPPKSETAPAVQEPVVPEGNTETAPKRPVVEEEFDVALARIKKRVGEMLDATSNETGAVQLRGSITEGMKRNSETFNDLKVVGAGMLHYGAREFSAWSDAMRQILVESGHDVTHLDSNLKALYEESQKKLKWFNKTNFKDELPSLVELRDALERGEPGFEWYDRAPQELKTRFGENADTWAGTYAATSPLQDAATGNIDLAHRAFNQIMAGERDGVRRKFTSRKDGIMPIVADNLNRVARGERVSGPKIGPFEAVLRQDARTSGARDIPVIDTWMYRLMGFMTDNPTDIGGGKSGTRAGRTFLETLITKMAAETGADAVQVQAALWTDVKARVERQRIIDSAQDASGQWKNGWDLERLDAELTKVTDAMGTPFDRLLLNRLGPAVEAIRSGDMTANGDALAVRKATMAMIENKAQPEVAATVALQGLGMAKDAASRVATAVADAYRASGLGDETGSFNFWKKAEAEAVPYDRVGAETVMGKKVTTHKVKDLLRADLNKPFSEAQVTAAQGARDALFADLQQTMDLMHQGVELPPGQLFHTATLAGAVADKVRSAANRWGVDREPGRVVGGEKPVGSKALTDFGESLHAAMTEPELYAKLRSLSPEARMEWLGNTHRAGGNAGRLYMTLYMNAMLSHPATLAKATGGDSATLPLSIGNRFMAEQWGRGFNMLENMGWLTKSDKHVVPGEAAQLAMNYWENIKDQVGLLSRKDWDGIHQQMVDAGEFRPPIANPSSLAGSIVNAVAGAPSSFLGAERSSHMVISRLGELRAQAWRQATLEGKTGVELKKQVEFYQRNPTKDMMQAAVNFAEENAFTRKMDGVFASAISKLTSTDVGKVLIDPFANITMNIMDYTMQGTPFLNLASKRWRAEFNQGGAARDMAMGKLSMGTAFIGTSMYLGFQGLVTGDGPRDPAVRKIWEQAGWRANHIYNPFTGKPMIDHRFLGPISGFLAAGADLAFLARHSDKQSAGTLVAGVAMALTEPLSHAGYIEVLSDITRAIKEGVSDSAFWNYIRDKALSAAILPNAGVVRFANEVADPSSRPMSTPSRGEWYEREWQTLQDSAAKNISGWTKDFPQNRNFISGKAVPRDGAAPWFHEVTSNKIAVEMDRLGQNKGKGSPFRVLQPPSYIGGAPPQEGVPLNDPSPYEAVRLESWEKDRLIQLLTEKPRQGLTLEQRLEKLIGSAQYKKYEDGPYGTKAEAIQTVYHQYLFAAQQDLLKEDKHLHWLVREQEVQRARAKGVEMKNPLGAMPEPTKYPRPGQKERP